MARLNTDESPRLAPSGRDLDTADVVEEFVRSFYREIAQDSDFHRYFHGLAQVDWHAHTGDLTDFWASVAAGAADRDGRDVIDAHRWLHDADPFDEALFARWIEILDTTIDARWSGPCAERIRHRGHGLAWAMAKRFVGTGRSVRPAQRP